MRDKTFNWTAAIKESFWTALNDAAKFLYGFMFGILMWSVLFKPYGRYYDFGEGNLRLAEFIFSILIGFVFMASLWARCLMVLFLPTMIGNASQNYIIVLLFVGLFTNPITNMGLNAIESVRVIGCSLTIAFEQLRERARLMLNPLVEIFSERNETDFESMRRDLLGIHQIIGDLRESIKLTSSNGGTTLGQRERSGQNEEGSLTSSASPAKQQQVVDSGNDQQVSISPTRATREVRNNNEPGRETMAINVSAQTKRLPTSGASSSPPSELELVARGARELLGNSSLELDWANFGVKANIDAGKFRQIIGSIGLNTTLTTTTPSLNLTDIMFKTCLDIFRDAKASCEQVVESMLLTCNNRTGPYFGALWCSPLFFTASKSCPFVMDQLVDERSLCNELQSSRASFNLVQQQQQQQQVAETMNATASLKVNGTLSSLEADLMLANISRQIGQLGEMLLEEPDQQVLAGSQRLELSITFNEETKLIFQRTQQMLASIKDKFELRRLLLSILSLLYDLYTTYTFFVIMNQARLYRRNYLTRIRFDNHYITGQFRELDARRSRSRMMVATNREAAQIEARDNSAEPLKRLGTCLPLTGDESRRFITAFSCRRRTREERNYQRASCAMILTYLAFALSLFYLDDIFRSILSSIQEHGRVQYQQLGHHELDVDVSGQGSVARLVRRLTSRLSSEYNLKRRISTEVCLPQPKITRSMYYFEFSLLVVIYYFIDQLSIYAMRLRSITCAYFYPDKELQRLVFLRSLILYQRRALAKSSMASYIEEDEEGQEWQLEERNAFTVRDAVVYLYNLCSCRSLRTCLGRQTDIN